MKWACWILVWGMLGACGGDGPIGMDGSVAPDADGGSATPDATGADVTGVDATADSGPGRPIFQPGIEIDIEGGQIEGARDGDLRVFRGVPYAAPPVGPLRLRDPKPVVPWGSIFDATRTPNICPQQAIEVLGLGAEEGEQDEDCLTLDVYAFDDERPRPVMVWIHGGAFITGSGTSGLYDGSALARAGDVVIVSINYRLGALGFLAAEALTGQAGDIGGGNYGIKDQEAALRWVERNISAFGGDPDNVTVFGESAGAISICALMAAPTADGYYHRAVIQSGVGCTDLPDAASPSSLGAPSAYDQSQELIREVGCGGADTLACLRSKNIDDLVSLVDLAGLFGGSTDGSIPVGAHVDGAYIAEEPLARLSRGEADVPLLLGTTEDEASLFLIGAPVATRFGFRRSVSATFGEDVADDVLEIYALFEFPVANDAYQTFATDVLFSCPNRALLRAAESGNPAFTYEFRKTVATTLLLGSHHALELPYLFGTFDELGIVPLPSDNQLSAEMQRAWTTFATHGVPQISSGWPEWSEDGETLVVLEDPVNLVSFDRFRGGRCDELAALGLVP